MFSHIVMNGQTFLGSYFFFETQRVVFANEKGIQIIKLTDEPFQFWKPGWAIMKYDPFASWNKKLAG